MHHNFIQHRIQKQWESEFWEIFTMKSDECDALLDDLLDKDPEKFFELYPEMHPSLPWSDECDTDNDCADCGNPRCRYKSCVSSEEESEDDED